MLARGEDFLDLGAADDMFDHFGAKLARHRATHGVSQVIDDIEILELDAVALGERLRLRIGADVKADNWRARCGGQLHVAFGDSADTRTQHAHLDQVSRDLVHGMDNCLDRTLYVGFDDQRIFLRLDRIHVGEKVLHIDRRRDGTAFGGEIGTVKRDFARARFIFDNRHRIAR